jgi:hypothetical protein
MPRPRGAIMSPHLYRMAQPHQLRANVPTSFGIVPTQLSMWLNDTYGDCVTAEEAYAKAVWSIMQGLPELFVPDSVVQQWASQNGYLNGATLTDVMATMAKSGFQVDGVVYSDGPPQAVDYQNWASLTSAISSGPVKIGVDADDYENAVNQTNGASGWFGQGWTDSSNQDHCTGLSGYGTVGECYDFLKINVPAVAKSFIDDNAVLNFTWDSIGVVLFPSVAAVTSEAWLRTPTTPQQVGPGPAPTPSPTPAPVGPPATAVWFDKASGQFHLAAGWTRGSNNLNPEIIVHPNNQIVEVPTVGQIKWTEV